MLRVRPLAVAGHHIIPLERVQLQSSALRTVGHVAMYLRVVQVLRLRRHSGGEPPGVRQHGGPLYSSVFAVGRASVRRRGYMSHATLFTVCTTPSKVPKDGQNPVVTQGLHLPIVSLKMALCHQATSHSRQP